MAVLVMFVVRVWVPPMFNEIRSGLLFGSTAAANSETCEVVSVLRAFTGGIAVDFASLAPDLGDCLADPLFIGADFFTGESFGTWGSG
jgi:hypothetical protein